ncbi:MAG: nodulation protein NfeD [Nitrospirae bacterium]|nr:nodulation protein NfeD [Nitrospirota bacterium]
MYKKFVPFVFISFLIALFFYNPPASEGSYEKHPEKRYPGQKDVMVINVDGIINPVASEYIGNAIRKASEINAEALVIKLDTPGGLDASMRSIVRDIIGSKVPVIVFVSPGGARAASAGVFIVMAAHIAAMSPGTNIGAAHPVAVGEKMDKVMAEKATNDAAAYIRAIAKQRGRNGEWAEAAVRKSVSITETEALKKNVIDLVAKNLTSLLSEVDGREIKTAAGDRTLKTANAGIIENEMSLRHKVLDFISNPNVAYILMLLGFYGLFFELTNPGAIFPGVIGGICLILGFYAFQTLPVNYAGLLLIILGIILFILEVKIISHGLLTLGGIVSLILGSLMLFESSSPFFKLSLSVIILSAVITALFFLFTFRLAYRAQRRKPVTGIEGLIGSEAVAKADITQDGGMVFVHGEFWSAYSDDLIKKDEKVVIESVTGLKVKVKRI